MAFVNNVETAVNPLKSKVFEDMEVDDIEVISKKNTKGDDSEEGEVSDDEDTTTVFPPPEVQSVENKKPERRFDNRAGGFITGIDVFGKEEQARLVERAKRFGLDSSNTHTLSEKELKKLYWSVGANEDDSDEKLRFDSLRMYGTEAMSTKDVFEYFSDYAPSSIEWLNDNSCNVIWLDNLSAVRALLGLSRPIKYPSEKKSATDNKSKKKKDSNAKEGESDIIMLDDDSPEEIKNSEDWSKEIMADPEAVDLNELEGNIPPGRWRKGKIHAHSDSILLRFAHRTNGSAATEQDERPARLPQPVFGMVGLISQSRKERIKRGLLVRPKIFQDDMGDERDFVISSDDEDNRNPWGTLAKSWGHIDRARRPPDPYDDMFGPYSTSPPPPALMLPRLSLAQPLPILKRVGFRVGAQVPRLRRASPRGLYSRSRSPSLSPERLRLPSSLQRTVISDVHRRLAEKRKRPTAPDYSDESSASESDSNDEEWTKRIKVPRMRMYADEEEKKSKKRPKGLSSRSDDLSYHRTNRTDLRSRIRSDRPRLISPPPSSSHHRARSPFRRDDLRRRYDREPSRRPLRNGAPSASVWLRLEKSSTSRASAAPLNRDDSDNDDYDSTADSDSRTSSSESDSEPPTVRSTVRFADGREPETSKTSDRVDLRSKLNKSKSTTTVTKTRPRSPLRIEIDNDYYNKASDTDKD